MITINYLPHSRLHFSKLLFYFMKKIKQENKNKIVLNIYTNNDQYFNNVDTGINTNIIVCSPIYKEKISLFENNNNTKYSIKLDEDIFLNNYLWDYIIENIDILDNDENLILAPLLSSGIPTTDYFIRDYFSNEKKEIIENTFLNFGFGINGVPRSPWGYDVEFLNELTIRTNSWDSEKWLEYTNNINHHFKGYHPIRNGYETHETLNSLLLNDLNKFINQNDFEIFKLKNRYYTNSMFAIKSDTWWKILNDKSLFKDDFDEVPLNAYMKMHDLNYCFIKRGYGIHTCYNTNYNINDEMYFYDRLEKNIIQ